MDDVFDLLVIGGGVNGCGIARDAAGRGAKVCLVEMNDLASGTSSWSTKLIHGGLRYLEYYEFRLVREALQERETLWGIAPHIIHPLRFVLPYQKGARPAWMLRAGLFLYDHIGGRKRLPATRTLDLTKDEAGLPLTPGHRLAFEYSDCSVDDARLVTLNAMDARARGATIRTRVKLVSARREGEVWRAEVENVLTGARESMTARRLVNAAGPWVADVLRQRLAEKTKASVRLVQGSHIVVKKLYDHDRCYFFQNNDGRIFFAIPYRGDFTLIGTTDRDYQGDPAKVAASADEIAYLLGAANVYFRRQLVREDVVWAYSGVRPLYDDGASEARAATRDYVFELDMQGPPLLSIFGGKITTYRRLAMEALDKLGIGHGPLGEGWTGREPLPGGDFPMGSIDALADRLALEKPFLTPGQAQRLARAYGTLAWDVVGAARSVQDLGEDFGAGLTLAEVDYLRREEWAMSAEDVLWRRSKLGLTLNAEAAERIGRVLRDAVGATPADTIPATAA
jgi:glycerol-3-phosphate dehydrogenase